MAKGKKDIPNNLRRYRLEAGLKQSEVAFLLDIKNVGRISQWESGQAQPGIEHLLSLSLIYNRLPDTLYSPLRTNLSGKLGERLKVLQEQKERLDSG